MWDLARSGLNQPREMPSPLHQTHLRRNRAEKCQIRACLIVVLVRAPHQEGKAMWDTVQTNDTHLSHDLPCLRCGHAAHTYLACSDTCDCVPAPVPGVLAAA